MMHVGLGRSHPLHIEYIHLGVCLGFIQDIMSEAILSHPKLHLSRKIAIVKALGKLVWIQNDLFAKWHVRDGCEYASHEEAVIEEEGYLHGKKVFDDVSSSDGDERAETPTKAPGLCPFSGILAGVAEVKLEQENPTAKDAGAEIEAEGRTNPTSPSRIPMPSSELPAMKGR
jgi:hypothetical protein